MSTLPKPGPSVAPIRVYRNHHLDSTRWEHYTPRDDDIVVTTSYKSGTTWMQQILHLLVFRGDPEALPVGQVSHWLDAAFHGPIEPMAQAIEAQAHRRFLKSHLPFDGLPHYEQVKYIVVGRDARDVFMSLWNHYSNYTDAILEVFRALDERHFPAAGDDPRALWREWMTRGWFDWESEGWPFWSNLGHTQSYWNERHRPNILLVHYSDLLAEPAAQIQRIADYLEMPLSAEDLEMVVRESAFDSMKDRYLREADDSLKVAFKGGAGAFIHKGSNGRWRGLLNEEDLALYEAAKTRVLSPDCARWLEEGALATADPTPR